jgi:hypothetical protein
MLHRERGERGDVGGSWEYVISNPCNSTLDGVLMVCGGPSNNEELSKWGNDGMAYNQCVHCCSSTDVNTTHFKWANQTISA